MEERLTRLQKQIRQYQAAAPPARRWLLLTAAYVLALVRDLAAGELSMRAMSLVYTTLLSIVPLLALAFSVLKALGVHNSLEPVLYEFLRPLGAQAQELSDRIIGFVERVEVGVLGSFGIALLFYTAISLIQKVETSFNFIWGVKQTRPLAQRVGEYLGVLMVGPVIVFSALGLTASVLNSDIVTRLAEFQPLGGLLYLITRMIPYALIIGVFSFMYLFMPNARVGWKAALGGGVAAGLGWQTASFAFASFAAGAGNYNAIYSGFAILILLLIWLYLGWLILLTGCQLSYYLQHPEHLVPQQAPSLGGRQAEYLALLIMGLVGRRFIEGARPYERDELAEELDVEPAQVACAVEKLVGCGFLTETGTQGTQLTPARDLGSVTLGELWRALRASPAGRGDRSPLGHEVQRLLDDVENAFSQGAGQTTLRAWLCPPGGQPQDAHTKSNCLARQGPESSR